MSPKNFQSRPLLNAKEARDDDTWTIAHRSVPGLSLMELAGYAVASEAQQLSPQGLIVVLCGPGNNGGDGWIAARHLCGRGINVAVVTLRDPEHLNGDAFLAAQMFVKQAPQTPTGNNEQSATIHVVESAKQLIALPAFDQTHLFIDALFGTGMSRPLVGDLGEMVNAINAHPAPVLAVDLPSGLPTDGGAPQGSVVQAHTTITFGAEKIGHRSEPGRFFCGELQLVNIGLQTSPDRSPANVHLVTELTLSPPDPCSHKGTFGHLGVLAGSGGTVGAAQLACHGALRAGAGLVTLLGPAECPSGQRPDVMTRQLAPSCLKGLNAIALGPGLGRNAKAQSDAADLLRQASDAKLRAVIDADALNLVFDAALPLVATPHPKEAAQLLGWTTQQVQADRLGAISALNARTQGHDLAWVLKGAVPVICGPDGMRYLVGEGAPALAVAGSGDVLTGLIGALLARGLPLLDAAIAGCFAHQSAGRRLKRGALVTEIADGTREWLV